jgi:hypothetical protein
MGHEFLEHFSKARSQHGKAAAPLVFSQKGEVYIASVKNLRQCHGNLLGQRKIGRRAPGKIDNIGAVFEVVVIGGVAHVLHPIGTFFVVFGKNVAVLRQSYPESY